MILKLFQISVAVFATMAATACGSESTTEIVPGLESLTLAPASVTVEPSESVQFSVTPVWSGDAGEAPVLSFTTTGGSVTQEGLYTAPAQVGSYSVRVEAGHVSKTADVTVAVMPPPGPATLFSSGFDDGTLGGLNAWGAVLPRVVDDPTANGGHSVQIDWSSGIERDRGLEFIAPAGHRRIFARFRYKQDATANNNGIKKTVRFRANINGTSGVPAGTFNIQNSNFIFYGDNYGDGFNHLQTGAGTSDPIYVNNAPNTFRDRWRYIEVMLDYTDLSSQKARLWVDGVLVLDASIPLSPAMSSTVSIRNVWFATVFNQPGDDRSEWFDDVQIATEYIGLPPV